MGSRNRERRKAKQRAREQYRRSRASTRRADRHDLFPGPPSFEVAEALVAETAVALQHAEPEEGEHRLKLLAAGPAGSAGHGLVNRAVMSCLQHAIGRAWTRGWQPADAARIVSRRYGARHARLAVDLVAAQMRGFAGASVHERWEAQLHALGAHVWWDHDEHYLERWGEREGLDRAAVIRCALEVLHLINALPEIPVLCPPPGTAHRSAPRLGPHAAKPDTGPVDQRMLDRVRALLAKAESTEFPEEAEAFTAKAQELMARHSIDHALLTARTGARDEPVGVRVGVDNPYEAAKALLLQQVAEANRCRTVWSRQLGFATVLGYPADLDSVELLYTSLLVQATSAMVHEGSRRDGSGRSRTRSFRQSFLNAFAIRIGQRLRAATADVSSAATAAEGRDRLLPVLAARDGAVRELAETLFAEMVSHQVSINNREGWASGTAAADLAALHSRRKLRQG